MRVETLSEKRQRFLGVVYYRCGFYFQRNGKRLHRAVWQHFNGPVPAGFHVHHVDHDRNNNQIENLQLEPSFSHISYHAKIHRAGTRPSNTAIENAKAWHGSEEGKQWHSEHYERHIRKALEERESLICQECGKRYETFKHRAYLSKFCHQNCKARALRRRRAAARKAGRLVPDRS